MKGHLNKEGGTVAIDLDVISRYAGLTAIECFGIVGMGMISMKDGLTRLLKDVYKRQACIPMPLSNSCYPQ